MIEFTVITNADGPLTKSVRPDGQGGITKTPAAELVRGTAEKVSLPFQEFGQFLRSLSKKQAIVHGVTELTKVHVVSAGKFSGQPATVTRSKNFFCYPEGSGLGMFDHDPKPGQETLSPDGFISIICSVWPDFQHFPTWWTPSTSSCILDGKGNQLTGPGSGWHMYFCFQPATKLPDLARWLFRRLWIAGHGHIFISKSGALLERTIFDASVFSPERLDFVAGANCIDCEQRLPAPVYREGKGEVAA